MSAPALERRGEVFVLTLGAGQNRFDRTRTDAIAAALDEVEAQAGRVALVTVGSDRFYSNGYDLDWLESIDRDERRVFIADYQSLLARMLLLGVATVAAISGHAYGAGLLFALAHDWRVMREDRGFLCLPEVDVGIPLRRGMVALLESRLSRATLRDAVLTGEQYGGTVAAERGLVDATASATEILDAACERAALLAGKDRNTTTALKRSLYGEAAELLSGSRAGAPR